MTTGMRVVNDFCWINLMTGQGNKAHDFFGKLFGWSWGEMPGVAGGTLIKVDGLNAGAMMDLDICGMPAGTPAAIGIMIRVDDADAVVAKINASGGSAEKAFDVMQNGRMAMCKDPNGAVFALWQTKSVGCMECDSHANGAPSWFETVASDAPRAAKFYADVFGWEVEEQKTTPEITYRVFKLDGRPIGGVLPLLPHMAGQFSHWGTYFAVDDADASAKRAAELGGQLCMPVTPIPGVGRFALVRSPEGVMFYLLEYAARS